MHWQCLSFLLYNLIDVKKIVLTFDTNQPKF